MKTLVTVTILLISLTNAMAQSSAGTSVVWPSLVQQQPGAASSGVAPATAVLATKEPGARSVVIAGNQPLRIGDLEDQAREMVLVVPGPDLKPEALTAITEDLTVMCRILDKTLYPGKRSTGASIYMGKGSSLGRLLMQQTGRSQGLYLDGYGVVFFVQVDFPLVPPPQQKEEPKPDESADRVWSQTMNELRGQEEKRDAEKTGPAYDGQRVENLKATLIKTLRHAANLRVRPDDQITLVVGTYAGSSTGTSHQRLMREFYASGPRSTGPAPMGARRADNPAADPAATLVLRISKADVDALAAGKLTLEQFAPKVQALWSAAQPQIAEPPATQPPASISR